MALWGGRFEGPTSDRMAQYSSSLDLDARLGLVDIRASKAHVRMLGRQKILPDADVTAILNGLDIIEGEWMRGQWRPSVAEDIHEAIEGRLIEKIGEAGKRMHTARSRNDQVATDVRLFLMGEVDRLFGQIRGLQSVIIKISEAHTQTCMPGMTHLQHAQPVSLAHHLMTYFWMLQRDQERFREARRRLAVLPLGSAALAGTGFALDRRMVADELGFEALSPNSIDAVSDRDFVIELLGHSSILMMHLSRLCEELILWSNPEFNFVELSDAVTTGSSIMPQKKNPDAAELVRGRTGRVFGALMGALTLMKGLPLAYNRDMQDDKFHLWATFDTLGASVDLIADTLSGAKWKSESMLRSLKGDFSNATDLADDLVTKGVSFRDAHEVVGELVLACLNKGMGLEDLSVEELQRHHSLFDESSKLRLEPLEVMRARKSYGGTAPERVEEQIKLARARLDL